MQGRGVQPRCERTRCGSRSRQPTSTPAPTPMPRDGKPVTGRHPTGGRREWRTRPSPPRSHVQGVAGCAGAGREGGAGQEGEEEETMHEASREGEQVGQAEGRRARPLLGSEPVSPRTGIRREREEEGNHARGVPARGAGGAVRRPEGPVAPWAGIRREERGMRKREEGNQHEASPRGGAGGAGRRPEGPAPPCAHPPPACAAAVQPA